MTRKFHRRRSREEWQSLITRFESSELSRREFCEQHQVNLTSFQRWHKRLESPKSRFVELKPPSARVERSANTPWSVEVELPNGTKLRLAV